MCGGHNYASVAHVIGRKLNIIISYIVFAQRVIVKLLAARFAIYLLDMLARLKVVTEIWTNTSISPIRNYPTIKTYFLCHNNLRCNEF